MEIRKSNVQGATKIKAGTLYFPLLPAVTAKHKQVLLDVKI
jgi:hypothetical protein